jgi:hypothetical protein
MGNTLVGSNQRVERDYVCRSAAWSETEFQQTNMAGTPYSVPCSGAATFTRQGNGWSVVMNQLVVPEASGQTPSLTLSMNTAWVEEGRELAEYNNVMGMFLEANLPLPDQVVISESSSASGLTPLANGQYQLAPNSQGFSLPETITGITGESMIWRRIDLMNEAPLDVGLIQKEFQTDRFVLYARSASATPMGSKLLACRSSTTSNQEALRMLVDAVTSIGGVSSKVIDICPLGVSFDQQTQRLRAANVLLTHNGVVDGTWVATLSARVGINVNIGPNR